MTAGTPQTTSYPRTLQEARRERRISQVRLAEKMGARQNHISDFERGARRPGPMTRAFLAHLLDYPKEVVDSWWPEPERERAA